ncbi:hypothetical protein [Tomitella gaofuii]|uniref:hypothetical protein n=1 Tax=Tomitella gaofuii TaxID=2760083 RepID=UPI0015FA1A9C|nr:hypothetical protein [Tomitella gaofuii]
MTNAATTDPTMHAISNAVLLGREGDTESARRGLIAVWDRIGPAGDPFHRCTLAHYLADLYGDAAESLIWNVRALDAADALTNDRARQHHPGLEVAGFYPSLHLNIADDLRRLGTFAAASEHIDRAKRHTHALPDDAYGTLIRTAIAEVHQAIDSRDTARRASAPGA